MNRKKIDDAVVDTLVADFSRHKRSFILSPNQWSKFELATTLTWKSEPLLEEKIHSIPETRGIYAHSICLDLPNIPPNGYVTYIGLVGDKKGSSTSGTSRHLRQRFKEYLAEQKKLDRPMVWEVLKQYADHMIFHYAEVPDREIKLHQIETALLDTLLPPCNQNDFSIEIGKAHKITTSY